MNSQHTTLQEPLPIVIPRGSEWKLQFEDSFTRECPIRGDVLNPNKPKSIDVRCKRTVYRTSKGPLSLVYDTSYKDDNTRIARNVPDVRVLSDTLSIEFNESPFFRGFDKNNIEKNVVKFKREPGSTGTIHSYSNIGITSFTEFTHLIEKYGDLETYLKNEGLLIQFKGSKKLNLAININRYIVSRVIDELERSRDNLKIGLSSPVDSNLDNFISRLGSNFHNVPNINDRESNKWCWN